MTGRFIGLISGTSMDGIDCALVRFSAGKIALEQYLEAPYSDALRAQLTACVSGKVSGTEMVSELSVRVAQEFARTVMSALRVWQLSPQDLVAIGSHGQTLWHRPAGAWPNTLQVGDPSTIAALTGITTVADFRTKDVALGGQGAPLVPPFHHAVFGVDGESRVILNLGGIANITLLPGSSTEQVRALDTGPGNTLLDQWIQRHHGHAHDTSGRFARSGVALPDLLERMLLDPYFARAIPKSTGRETFNLEWLDTHLQATSQTYRLEDIQATLIELTVESIARHIEALLPDATRLYVCGGGVRNDYLMERLAIRMSRIPVASTDEAGVPPQAVEAMAFAWLARQRLLMLPGNLPNVTGASRPAILGGVYAP